MQLSRVEWGNSRSLGGIIEGPVELACVVPPQIPENSTFLCFTPAALPRIDCKSRLTSCEVTAIFQVRCDGDCPVGRRRGTGMKWSGSVLLAMTVKV